jgi:hypothetical protein
MIYHIIFQLLALGSVPATDYRCDSTFSNGKRQTHSFFKFRKYKFSPLILILQFWTNDTVLKDCVAVYPYLKGDDIYG